MIRTTASITALRKMILGSRFSTFQNAITSEKVSGFNTIVERAASILHNLTYEDRRVSILQIYQSNSDTGIHVIYIYLLKSHEIYCNIFCIADLVDFKSRHIDIDLCVPLLNSTDSTSNSTEENLSTPLKRSASGKSYASSMSCNFQQPLPFPRNTYPVIACLFPLATSSPPLLPAFPNMIDVLVEDGYLLVGASEALWKKENLFDRLQDVENASMVSCIALNCAKTPLPEPYYLSVLKKSYQ